MSYGLRSSSRLTVQYCAMYLVDHAWACSLSTIVQYRASIMLRVQLPAPPVPEQSCLAHNRTWLKDHKLASATTVVSVNGPQNPERRRNIESHDFAAL